MSKTEDIDLTVSTQAELGKIFGVSTRSITRWVSEGMPKKKDGVYDAIEIARWRGVGINGGGEGSPAEETNEKRHWDIQFRKYRALHEKALFEKEKSLLLPVIEVERRETALAAIFVQALTLYENRLPPLLEGKSKTEMHEIIQKENDYLRKRIVSENSE